MSLGGLRISTVANYDQSAKNVDCDEYLHEGLKYGLHKKKIEIEFIAKKKRKQSTKQNLCPCRKLNLEKKSTGGASENVSLNSEKSFKSSS